VVDVRNETGGTLAEGTLVYFSGWSEAESRFLVSKAQASALNPRLAQFIIRTAILNNANGQAFKTHRLLLQNTLGSTVGAAVYLSATVAGAYTLTAPSFAKQLVGRVAVVSATIGEIEFFLLSDSDSGFVRSNPGVGEFPVSAIQRNTAGHLEVEYDDVSA